MTSSAPPTPMSMRDVLGRFCTGIAVITASDGVRPYGFTCQSVTSVSLDPPYISFCPARKSTSWPMMRDIGALCVNILAHNQHPVCTQFAVSAADKFSGVRWRPALNGAPLIEGAVATIEATVRFEHDAGDHTIVVAQVTGLHASDDRLPLLFYRGGYGAIA
jgi:3-hydroxy-9,10-secoandrosta-1,3,5(10)-triene-9,17-dione monooxygenase reductase component